MLPEVFPLLAAASAVTSLIGTNPVRAYRHGRAPQGTAAPYVTWFLVTGLPENTLDEVPRVDRHEVQVDCWSENTGQGSKDIEALAKAVRDAIEPHAHMTAEVFDGIDEDTQRYRIGMQFTFWTDRS